MKDKDLRENFKKLCYILGISYDTTWDKIRINYWNYSEGGDPDLKPITRECLRVSHNEIMKRLNALAEYLGVEWHTETEKEGYKKIKK